MKILNKMFGDSQIAIIEEKYNAKYVIDSCLADKNGGWCNFPCAIFYTEVAHPEGSNYFALYQNGDGQWRIANGISAVQGTLYGLLVKEGLLNSRYRHDYVTMYDCMVDGGRDYFKYSPSEESKDFRFYIVEGKIREIVDFEYDTGKIIA